MDRIKLHTFIDESASYLSETLEGAKPEIGVILGSGLGPFAETVKVLHSVDGSEIPNYPTSTVHGHAGRLVHGLSGDAEILIVQGRIHFYEGYKAWQVTYPARLFHAIGIKSMIVTNASGTSNPEFKPGDFMLIKDHLNFIFREPLESWERDSRPSGSPYDEGYIRMAREAAGELGINLREGVLSANLGPSYETPAEVKLQRSLGADAASMSTLPEVTVAGFLGIRVLGISVLTNYAAGLSRTPLTHNEVTEMAEEVSGRFSRLIENVTGKIAKE